MGDLPAVRAARENRVGHPRAGGADRVAHVPVQVIHGAQSQAVGDATGAGVQGGGAFALAGPVAAAAVQAGDDLRVADPLLQAALLQVQRAVAGEAGVAAARTGGPPRRDDGPETCDGKVRAHEAPTGGAPAAADGGVAPEAVVSPGPVGPLRRARQAVARTAAGATGAAGAAAGVVPGAPVAGGPFPAPRTAGPSAVLTVGAAAGRQPLDP